MSQDGEPIAVLGAGSWGTALGLLLSGNGVPTRLWGHDPREVAALQRDRSNDAYLPGIAFPDQLHPIADISEAVDGCRTVLVVVPSFAFRQTLTNLRDCIDVANTRIAWATKGLEQNSGRLLHEIVEDVLQKPAATAVLSGPTFAREVAEGLPTAITIASAHARFANWLADTLHNPRFRAYTSDDITGVELGGAVKNVLAIAAGIADGLQFGANTRAALITRGLHEMMLLGQAYGARTETFMGLAGLGDLALTCTDNQSRNRRMGMALARGLDLDQAREEIGQAVEGVNTAREVHRIAERHQVEMPICSGTYRVLYEGLAPQDAVADLLSRQQKAELED